MFFGFSRKFGNRNKNRNRNRKKKFTTRKKGNSSSNNNNNNNVKFKIEEIDTPPSQSRSLFQRPGSSRVKVIETESNSPIILSDTRSGSRSQSRSRSRSQRSIKKRNVQMRTPTPYHHSTPTPISVVPVSKSTSMSTVKSLNSSGDIILFFMDMLTTVKLYHWKTMNYATHKATDELYDDLNKYVDEFVEVLLGYKGGVRAKLPRTQVTLHDCNSLEEFKKKIDGYKNVLIGFTSRFDGKKNSDLLNIRDEILATLNKSLYVMSFK